MKVSELSVSFLPYFQKKVDFHNQAHDSRSLLLLLLLCHSLFSNTVISNRALHVDCVQMHLTYQCFSLSGVQMLVVVNSVGCDTL